MGIPPYKASLGVQQSFTFGNGASLTPRVDVNYEAKREQSDIRAMSVPSFTVVNARVTFRTRAEDWESSVALMNVADRYYFYNIMDSSLNGGYASAQPAPPRTWYVSLRRNFN